MVEQPALTKTQRDVLFTVRYAHRDERWDHKTLSYLRSLGLVSSTPIETAMGRPSRSVYRWAVTPLGIHVYGLPRGAKVPGSLPAEARS